MEGLYVAEPDVRAAVVPDLDARCSTPCSFRRDVRPSDRSRKRRRRWTSWDSRRRQDRQRSGARGGGGALVARRGDRSGRSRGRQPLAGGRGRRAGGRSRGGRTKAQIAGRDVGFRTDEDRRVRGAVGVVHRPRLSHHGDAHGAVASRPSLSEQQKKISSPTSSGRRRRRSNRRGDAWDRRCRTASTPCFDPETKTTRGMRRRRRPQKSDDDVADGRGEGGRELSESDKRKLLKGLDCVGTHRRALSCGGNVGEVISARVYEMFRPRDSDDEGDQVIAPAE